MKKYFSFISLLICLLAFSNPILAQVDNRQRAISTIVADGLAQLPAQKPDVYNKVIGELAGTGTEGIQMIINMLTPADKGKNATFEYAINGIVNYVTLKENAGLKDAIRKGLTEGLAKCTDNANRAFLLSQLQKCATADDAATFTKYLSDSYLSDFASRALMSTPGIDNQIIDLMKSGVAPKNMLASIASFRKLNAPEIKRFPDRQALLLRYSMKPDSDLEYPIRLLAKDVPAASVFLGKVGLSIDVTNIRRNRFGEYDYVFLLLDEDETEEQNEKQGKGPETLSFNGGSYAVIRFRGTHSDAEKNYKRLMLFIKKEGYEPAGHSLEITLIDAGLTTDEKQYVTEIQLPVKKPGK